MRSCERCRDKGEIIVKQNDFTNVLITCPDCVKPNRKVGVVGKHE